MGFNAPIAHEHLPKRVGICLQRHRNEVQIARRKPFGSRVEGIAANHTAHVAWLRALSQQGSLFVGGQRHLLPTENVAVLLVRPNLDHILPIGRSRLVIHAKFHGIREVDRVGRRINLQTVALSVFRAKIQHQRARIFRRSRENHLRHIGADGQRIDVIDQTLLLVNGEGIGGAQHRR